MAVLIALGANQGDCRRQLLEACDRLRLLATGDFKMSSIWQSEPAGMSDDSGTFLNAVVKMEVKRAPQDLLRGLQTIEIDMGRPADHGKNVARPIDLDIVTYGDLVLSEPSLTVPHPRMHLRQFVLLPVREVAPEFVHPVTRAKIETLILNAPNMDIRKLD